MKIIKTYPRYLTQPVKLFYSAYTAATDGWEDTHCRLPDGTLDLVFNLGAPVLYSNDGIHFSMMPKVALTGLYREKKYIRYTGATHLVGVVLQPGFAHLFVEDGLQHYAESALDAALIFGRGISLLSEQLHQLPDDRSRHRLLEDYLAARLPGKDRTSCAAVIHAAVLEIEGQKGHVSMETLYRNSFMSERTFRRKFTECVGIGPKHYATIIKIKAFSKQHELLRSTYTAACQELGYTDPSHFMKDFRKIAGSTPSTYFGQLDRIGAEFIHLI